MSFLHHLKRVWKKWTGASAKRTPLQKRRVQLVVEGLEERVALYGGVTEFQAPSLTNPAPVHILPGLTGQPSAMIFVPSVGKFFFGEQQQERVGILDPNTLTVQEFQLPAHFAPHDFHFNPNDGRIYISSLFDRIGRFNPAAGGLNAIAPSFQPFDVGFNPPNPQPSAPKPAATPTHPTHP